QGGLLWDEETRDAEETPMELSFTNVDFRFAAMILDKRAINPSLLVSAFQMFHHDTNWGSLNKVDRLIGSAILASLPWDFATVRNAFERLRMELQCHRVHPEGRILAAASRLAAGPMARETMVERFSVAMSHLAGTFDPAFAPAAMIAANPLEPLEAIDVFRDCIAVVTRSSFYDLTLEIEELALILSYG